MTAEEDYQKCLNTDRRIAREEGHEEGRAEGHTEAQIEIARNLKKIGIPLKDIANSCNLSVEEIKKYLKK